MSLTWSILSSSKGRTATLHVVLHVLADKQIKKGDLELQVPFLAGHIHWIVYLKPLQPLI